MYLDDEGDIHSFDFTNFRKLLIEKCKSFNIFKPETYMNFNWNYLKYIFVILLGYFIFSFYFNDDSYLIYNNNENPENQDINQIDYEQRFKEELSSISNKLIEEIKDMLENFLLYKKENFETIYHLKIIYLIEKTEKLLDSNKLIEKLENLKKLKLEFYNISKFNENFIIEDNFDIDFDDDRKSSISNSIESKKTNIQSED